jgi:hypothetical protein
LTASIVNDMTALSAPNLQTVGGRFGIQFADLLATISIPALRSIGTLVLQDLPSLTLIDAGDGGFTNVTSATIRETALRDLNWLQTSTIEDLQVEDNLNLTSLRVAGLSVAESYISITGNSPIPVSFPDLALAYNISIEGCSGASLPLLRQVNRSFTFADNSFEELELPQLLDVGDNFMLWNNSLLSSVSIPVLANVSDDVVISHNPALGGLSFPDLGVVEGDISANGSFSEYVHYSSLFMQKFPNDANI